MEGSLEPATICEMHPTITPAEVQERYRTTDFGGFLDAYKWVSQLLQTPQQYALATRHLLQRLQLENVSYVELTLSVGVILWKKQNVADIFEAINKETQQSPIPCFWIFDFIRHFELDHAMEVAEWAIAYRNAGVIGFGCGGDESRGPATKYLPAFQKAQSAGLHLAPHAGETSNAESIWDALRVGAERIGHGIRAAEDPTLLAELRQNKIPLEICISSNVATGAVAALKNHPVRRIADAGVAIILNTDDPAMFRTTLSGEYAKAGELGFSESELQQLAEESFLHAFQSQGAA